MMSCLYVALMLILGYAISWGITCGLVALICLCFGWTFSWLIATGIWLVAGIVQLLFK